MVQQRSARLPAGKARMLLPATPPRHYATVAFSSFILRWRYY
jgi:hypothetical protein